MEVCKVKGFTLNYKNSKNINFECIKTIIMNDPDNIIPNPVIISDNIRNTCDHTVITRTESKTFNARFMKRRLIDTTVSIPYGFKRRKLN